MSVAAADNFFADNFKYLLIALVLHGALGAFLVVGLERSAQTVTPQLAIKGVMIDNTQKRLQRERQEAEQRAREQAEAERKAREEEQAREQAREEARREQQREAERKEAEQKRLADAAEKKRAQERQAAAKKAADDKKRAADIKAKQAEQQKKEREARDQAAREAELKRQLADEEGRMQAENAGLLNQYAALIEQRVVRNWNKPATARPGIQCEVKVTQATGGTVLSVAIGKCNGDSTVRQSIEAAVHRSSPLPPPPDPRLFSRTITFIFKPTE